MKDSFVSDTVTVLSYITETPGVPVTLQGHLESLN